MFAVVVSATEKVTEAFFPSDSFGARPTSPSTMVAALAFPETNVGVPESVTFAGKVTFAEPAATVFAVFVTTSFTDVYGSRTELLRRRPVAARRARA